MPDGPEEVVPGGTDEALLEVAGGSGLEGFTAEPPSSVLVPHAVSSSTEVSAAPVSACLITAPRGVWLARKLHGAVLYEGQSSRPRSTVGTLLRRRLFHEVCWRRPRTEWLRCEPQ